MKKTMRMTTLLLAIVMLLATVLVGCKKEDETPVVDPNVNNNVGLKQGTYRTFTGVMPSNWNELTYQDNNDTQILSYIGSSFFEYDYKFDEALGGKFKADGTVNAEAIVSGSFTTNFSAATKLEDVTSTVDAKWGYTEDQIKEGGYAWKITLREDLKWDDGTPIDATDFVYSMMEQLNPLFMNYRASTYYNNILIKNAKTYLYNGKEGYDAADSLLPEYNAAKDAEVIWKLNSSSINDATTGTAMSSVRAMYNSDYEDYGMNADQTGGEYLVAFGNAVGAPLSVTAEQINALEGKTLAAIKADTTLKATYDAIMAWWGDGDLGAYSFSVAYYKNEKFDFANVGLYAPSKYELVICLDAPRALLKEDGSLSYMAAYYMSSLPLVKKDLYEACKKAPATGSTLWTTNYNSTQETSASWGPYKLASFQSGKAYELVRNDNWFGYGLETNKNQYNITKIYCELVDKAETQWMGFLSGQFDGIGIDTEHLEYVDSKYAVVNYGSAAYGIQIYSNLDVLKVSGRNNGILAIQDFRQALSLSLNRDEFNKTVFGTLPPTYGIIGEGYFSDVENGIVYRNTPQAKEALLRVYGFTENADGTWSDGTHTYPNTDKAYDAMNGYNPTVAKQYLEKAIKELTENADKYGDDATKDIELLYGATSASETSTKKLNFMQGLVDELTKGTALEGKIKITMDTKYGSTWSDSFKAGSYDLCIVAGIGGNIFNPFNTIGAFVDPNDSLKFSSWWDSSKEDITFTMPAGDYEGAGKTHTMSVVNWYFCLNGIAESEKQPITFNWGEGFAPYEARLEVLAMLEEYVLNKFFSVQCSFDAEMALDGAKFSSISDEYNTFMGYGGIRYNIVNYTDAEWEDFVKQNNGDLSNEYKKGWEE